MRILNALKQTFGLTVALTKNRNTWWTFVIQSASGNSTSLNTDWCC